MANKDKKNINKTPEECCDKIIRKEESYWKKRQQELKEETELIKSTWEIILNKNKTISEKYEMMSREQKHLFYKNFMTNKCYFTNKEGHSFKDVEEWMSFFENNFLSFNSQDRKDLCRYLKSIYILHKWHRLEDDEKELLCEYNIWLAKNFTHMLDKIKPSFSRIFLQRSDNLHYDFLLDIFVYHNLMSYDDIDEEHEIELSHSKIPKLVEELGNEKIFLLCELFEKGKKYKKEDM